MIESPFDDLLPVAEPPLDRAHVADMAPGAPERPIVTQLLEDRDRLARELEQLGRRTLGIAEKAEVGELDLRSQPPAPVAGRRSSFTRLHECRFAALEIARHPLRDAELTQQLDTLGALGREKCSCATEQVDRCRRVGALPRADAGGSEPFPGPRRKSVDGRIGRT